MHYPVLLGSSLTNDEFKHLCDFMNLFNYPIKDISYFWVLSDLSIEYSNIRPHTNFSNCAVLTMNEFLSYINEQKLLRILE